MLYYAMEWRSLDGHFQFKEISTPDTPQANEIRLYAKDDGAGVSTLCYKNDAGTEICLPSSGSIVTGTGVNGRLAFWNGTSTLSSDADLTFSVDTLTATKIIAPTSITISALTQGSLVFAGASGLLSQDNSHLFWDDTNDTFYIGTTTSPNSGISNRGFVLTKAGAITECALYGFGNVGQGVVFRGSVARGTLASPTQALSGDNIAITAVGHDDSTGWATLARIDLQAAENITTTSQGSLIVFNTKATGSTTLTERFRVGPSGQWGIGGATFGTAGNYFRSGGSAAAPTWQQVKFTELDFTGSNLTSIVTRNHSDLAGLTSGDNHTQYALLAGRSGGQILKGGTAAADILSLVATAGVGAGSEAIKFFIGNNGGTEVARVQGAGMCVAGSGATLKSPDAILHLRSGTNGTAALELENTSGGSGGATFAFYANTASPAANDDTGVMNMLINDSGGTSRIANAIIGQFLDPTSTTMDSQIVFAVMNNVNAGDVNTFASLSSLGVWTNACMAINKQFEGDVLSVWPDFWVRLKQLSIQRYRSMGLPDSKVPTAQRHVSCSAEDLDAQFGLGVKFVNPITKQPILGIASSELGSLALAAAQLLVARVEALEAKLVA